jgi:hypothetical protein
MVAGAAALLLSQNPNLTYAQLKSLILDNVDPLPAFAGKTVSGGRLNIYKALAAAPAPARPGAAPLLSATSPQSPAQELWRTTDELLAWTFQSPLSFVTGGSSGGSIAAGDFNGDGWTDLVVVNGLSSSKTSLTLLLNDQLW